MKVTDVPNIIWNRMHLTAFDMIRKSSSWWARRIKSVHWHSLSKKTIKLYTENGERLRQKNDIQQTMATWTFATQWNPYVHPYSIHPSAHRQFDVKCASFAIKTKNGGGMKDLNKRWSPTQITISDTNIAASSCLDYEYPLIKTTTVCVVCVAKVASDNHWLRTHRALFIQWMNG